MGPGEGVTGLDSSAFPLYEGSIGLVLDTRPLFKRGYAPAEAALAFPDHPELDTALEIDPLTNLAILVIQNDSLTDAQRAALDQDVSVDISIADSTGTVLTVLSGEPVRVNDSNDPLSIDDEALPPIAPPLVLTDGLQYLLIPEGFDGLLTMVGIDDLGFFTFDTQSFKPNDEGLPWPYQQFRLSVSGQTLDRIENESDPTNSAGCVLPALVRPRPSLVFSGRFSDGSACSRELSGLDLELEPAVLEVEPVGQGWVLLRTAGNADGYAVYEPPNFSRPGRGSVFLDGARGDATRFRFVSGSLFWEFTDRGTSFNQPIIPPANLDFAYQTTLTNCSASTLTEVVGTEVTRTRRTTFGTSESFQVVAGLEYSLRTQVGASAKLPLGVPVGVSMEVESTWKVNTSFTYQTGNTFERTEEVATQVSRTREIVLPPYTALTAADVVRTIENVRTPFIQRIRVKARNAETNRALSGPELRTHIGSAFFEGVVTRVGGDFVEVSIRGEALTDQFIQAETAVHEVPNACD